MSVWVGLSVTVHLWFLSDGVDVRLYSCDGFWVAISEQYQRQHHMPAGVSVAGSIHLCFCDIAYLCGSIT